MITEETMSYEDMEKAAKNNSLCTQCQGLLVLAWGFAHGFDGWILRCTDISHTGITRHNIKQEKIIKEAYSMDSTALIKMEPGQMMERIEMAKFPKDLTTPEKKMLAQVAITYGFDPLMGEITIYQGRPWVSIDGRYRKAQETGKLDGVSTRPATKQEREDWQIPDGDYFFRSEVYVKEARFPFVAWGRVRGSETQGGKGYTPVETNPQRMAEKRAEGQALRKAFHIPLPSIEDIGSPDYGIESTAIEVNTDTGEIVETPSEPPESTRKPTKGEYSGKTKEGCIDEEAKADLISSMESNGVTENWLFDYIVGKYHKKLTDKAGVFHYEFIEKDWLPGIYDAMEHPTEEEVPF